MTQSQKPSERITKTYIQEWQRLDSQHNHWMKRVPIIGFIRDMRILTAKNKLSKEYGEWLHEQWEKDQSNQGKE